MTIYSHSRLSCYEQCPQKYKLQYIDKVKTEVKESAEIFLGRRVHETLKRLYQDLMYQKRNTLEDLLSFLHDEWAKNWNDSIMIVKRENRSQDYLKMAEKYVSNYYDRYKPFNHGRTIALEKHIIVDLDRSKEYKLSGHIDRISKTKDGCYHIHDYKTCSCLPSLEYFQNDRQLSLYAIALKQKYPYIKNVCLVWHFLKFDKEITTMCSDEQLDEFKKNTFQLIDIIENTEEFPIKSSKLCNWCKLKLICRY